VVGDLDWDEDATEDGSVSDNSSLQKDSDAIYVQVRFEHGLQKAPMDAAAKSVWVDEGWFMKHGGRLLTPSESGSGATGADGGSLEVTGR
jgi:hypothetical protein